MTGNSEAAVKQKDKVKGKMLMLLKNDFLASARVIPLFYIIEAVCLIAFMYGRHFNNDKVLAIGFATSFLVAFVLVLISFFFVIFDYQKSLFGQQGYLSFTLPVNSRQLLGSKVIVYGAWLLLSYLNAFGVMYFLSEYVNNMYGQELETAGFFLELLNLPSKTMIIVYFIYFVVMIFALFLSFLMAVYFSIALSHIRVFQKANIVWSVIIFVCTVVLFVVLVNVLNKYLGIYCIMNVGADTSWKYALNLGDINYQKYGADIIALNLMSFVVLFGQSIAYFFGGAYVMHKYVNIK